MVNVVKIRKNYDHIREKKMKKPELARSNIPNDSDIINIPLARAGEYELSDREIKTVRSRVYALNKHNAARWRWRTMREGNILLIWRIK